MQVIGIKREFKYNGIVLADPNPQLSIEDVRGFYAGQYPELNNSVVEGPVTKNNVAAYSFARAAGAKGRVAHPVRDGLRSLVKSETAADGSPKLKMPTEEEGKLYAKVGHFMLGKPGGKTIPLPSKAFGLWG